MSCLLFSVHFLLFPILFIVIIFFSSSCFSHIFSQMWLWLPKSLALLCHFIFILVSFFLSSSFIRFRSYFYSRSCSSFLFIYILCSSRLWSLLFIFCVYFYIITNFFCFFIISLGPLFEEFAVFVNCIQSLPVFKEMYGSIFSFYLFD